LGKAYTYLRSAEFSYKMKWFEPFAVLLLSIVLAFQLKLSNEIGGLNAEIGGLHAEMSKMSSQHNETHAQILTLNGKVDDATHFARNRVQALAKSTCYLPLMMVGEMAMRSTCQSRPPNLWRPLSI